MNVKKIVFAPLIISTVSYALPTFAGSCEKQGSSVSISKITSKYKNCVNCGTKKDSKGKTVYYCYCGDGCKGTPAPTAESLVASFLGPSAITSSKPSTTASKSSSSKSSGSCKKQGSSVSIKAITSKYKNCSNCGTKKDSKGKTVYYCYCGDC